MSTAQACRVLGISEATLCRWRQRDGSMSRSEAKELRELREQNARLKQLLGQAELEEAALRELAEGNFSARRAGTTLSATWLARGFRGLRCFLSVLRGRVAGLSRSAYCRARAASGVRTLRDHGPVRQWMNEGAGTHRRWGYKRAWARAESEGIVVGRDTFWHLWHIEGLRVRPRKAHKLRTAPCLQCLVTARTPGQVSAIDFQFDSDRKGRVIQVCHVIDEFTRQHLAFRVERSMGADDVIEMLDLAVLAHGAPQVLRADNGHEFITAAVGYSASEHDTLQAFIPPGQPWHNGFVEPIHNRMRDELLEDNMFDGLDHDRTLIVAWSLRYNEEHPHSALGWLAPNQYARQWAQHHQ